MTIYMMTLFKYGWMYHALGSITFIYILLKIKLSKSFIY